MELSRNQLKSIQGGRVRLESIADELVRCCWDDDPTNCSSCVATEIQICSPGEHIAAC